MVFSLDQLILTFPHYCKNLQLILLLCFTYPQGVQENQPALSLAPFKDGIYSVEFNSSLSVLQAFSICIAVLDSRNLCEFSEFRESKATVQDDGTSDPNQTEGEVPARYASYPPLSPVGRV